MLYAVPRLAQCGDRNDLIPARGEKLGQILPGIFFIIND
jgi:hypothetical protein